ncbi:hypothetical protein C4J81_01560 [Deltaproteobacteria bacterium Smac51]|nr:hypothetical protein C4J81_01560 [Deltaproteobacteria bacterium Smac51]
MRHTVRAFIVFLVTITVAAVFVVVALLFYRPVSDRIISEQTAELTRVTTLLAQSAERKYDPKSLRSEFEAWGRTVASLGDYRLSLISSDGELLDDSRLSASTVRPDADNHGNRPEVLAAFSQGSGLSLRYSATTGHNYIYVARRIDFKNGEYPPMVLRLGAPYSLMSGLKGDIYRKFAFAAFISIIFAFVFSYVSTRELKDDLKRLNEMAADLADGRLQKRLVRHPKNDLGDLGLTLNRLASRYSRDEKRYQAEEARLGSILENMEEGVLVTDSSGSIVNSNQAAAALFELENTPTGLPGEFIRQPEMIRALEMAAKGQPVSDKVYRIPGAPDKFIRAHMSPIIHEGQVTGVVAVFNDDGPAAAGVIGLDSAWLKKTGEDQ